LPRDLRGGGSTWNFARRAIRQRDLNVVHFRFFGASFRA
jgi:hypothetical protein